MATTPKAAVNGIHSIAATATDAAIMGSSTNAIRIAITHFSSCATVEAMTCTPD